MRRSNKPIYSDLKPIHTDQGKIENKHWKYFHFKNIMQEARARLKEAQDFHHNEGDKNKLEYWIAWTAHANAIAVASLLEESK